MKLKKRLKLLIDKCTTLKQCERILNLIERHIQKLDYMTVSSFSNLMQCKMTLIHWNNKINS